MPNAVFCGGIEGRIDPRAALDQLFHVPLADERVAVAVFAARRRDTGEAVAVKQYDKRACLTVSGGLDMLFRERDILLHLSARVGAVGARAAG